MDDGDFKPVEEFSDEHMYSWYFSKEEIEYNSPSRKDGIDQRKEAEIRLLYCSFLRDLGIRLELPQMTIATAIMFCHRFYLHQSLARNGWQTVATVCIFLASKAEDTPCQLDKVVRLGYETVYKRDPVTAQRIHQKDVFEKQKALILIGERLVLATIRFDFNVQHPYKPLLDAMKKLGITQKDLKQVAWNFVNDWLRTTLCLQYKPHYIAAGSLYLAAKVHNVRLPLEKGHVWWHEFDVAPKPLEAVIQQMMELVGLKRLPITESMKQMQTPSGSKPQMSNSPDSVLFMSGSSGNSSSHELNGEANDHQLVNSDCNLTTKQTANVENLCIDELNGEANNHHQLVDSGGNLTSSQTASGENFCIDEKSLDIAASNVVATRCQEQLMTNCDHLSNAVSGENSCAGERSADDAAASTRCVESFKIDRDHLSHGLKKVDVMRIKEMRKKRKRQRETNTKAVGLDDSEEAWIETELESGIVIVQEAVTKQRREIRALAISFDDSGEEAWIEKELESGIIVGTEPSQTQPREIDSPAVSLDDLSEEAWIERELESGIVV